MSDKKVINCSMVLEQVGGDIEFLKEVLLDLVVELRNAEININYGVKTRNFSRIATEAHKIKGSAAYLQCEQIVYYAANIQLLGISGENELSTSANEEKLVEWMNLIEIEFNAYKAALVELREKIELNRLN